MSLFLGRGSTSMGHHAAATKYHCEFQRLAPADLAGRGVAGGLLADFLPGEADLADLAARVLGGEPEMGWLIHTYGQIHRRVLGGG